MITYLQIENLHKSFGDRALFDSLSLSVGEGQRIGLVARNGAGKTTLLRIIAGREDYGAGQVTLRRDLKMAFLEQDPAFTPGTTVMEAALKGDSPELQAIARYEMSLASGDGAGLERAMADVDALGAWNYEARVKQILTRLNITDYTQKTEHLSGGQTKRLALAGALISQPDLLILDEPTNHLDMEMTGWLEEYLVSSGVTLLMVTHDRYFLDKVCTQIVEIEARRTYAYNGNYSYFLEKKQERLDAEAASRESDKNLYRKELDWMRRQPQARATKARARIESFYELEERLRREREAGSVRLDVKAARIGKKIFEVRGLSKSYGERVILNDFNYLFARYEKMGIVGDNGTGKSTFIKMLLGLVPPDRGTVEVGETVRFGYYSQQGIEFDPGARVIDVVTQIAENVELGDGRRMSASQLLQYFLFMPATQYDLVGKLSGGERRRLYLCTILMQNPNFLVLDEPTNDLDIMTLQVLEEYLAGYGGCLIVVSHDRYFMDKVADHLLVFEGNGRIKDFPGSYSDYLEWARLREAEARQQEPKTAPKPVRPDREPALNERKKLTYAQRREMEALDRELPELEAEKALLEQQMSSGSLPLDELTAKSERIAELIDRIDTASMRWLELSEIEG